MIKLDPWRDAFVLELRLRRVTGRRIGDLLAQVDAHCADSGEEVTEAFGDPVAYAQSVAELSGAADRLAPEPPWRAGVIGGGTLVGTLTLLASIDGLVHGRNAALSLGDLIGAVTGTVAIVVLVRFFDSWLRARLAIAFAAVGLALGSGVAPMVIWRSAVVEANAWASSGAAVVLLAAVGISLRGLRPDHVVDPVTGHDSLSGPHR
jgi:hypothetical protein